jgi:hypothetical protein
MAQQGKKMVMIGKVAIRIISHFPFIRVDVR